MSPFIRVWVDQDFGSMFYWFGTEGQLILERELTCRLDLTWIKDIHVEKRNNLWDREGEKKLLGNERGRGKQ